MPASRPRASFEPIPPDFDVRTFVETSENFQYVDRISYEMIASNGIEQFEKLVLLHVIIGGKPLVIDGFEEVLDPWTFTPSWLRDNHGDKIENARNLTSNENIPLTIAHYLKHMGKLTDQFFDAPERYRDKTRQRIYLKDIDCPPVWHDKVKEHIPSGLFYLNESTGEIGGPGALDEPGSRKGRGIGRAGDLMSSLPPEMRAENLMCYIGHEGTYTPSHREMCASLGQNIMVNASGTISEEGKSEHPGSSLWFMTETKDRQVVSEYWLSVLGHDIEVENHFAQLIAWKKAPFKTYVVEQRPGDFILIPPLAPHQVWNRGTRTMKVAWNRTTVETLELAMSEALPNSRIVCRDEQYKNKAIVYYTLLKYSNLIRSARSQVELGGEQADAIQRSVKVRQVQRDFKRLFDLYKNILLSEMFRPESREHPEFIPYDSNITCSYCRCNIFNRFLTCKSCNYAFDKEVEETYDICMDCYSMGRSCACQSGYTWAEQWKWKDLIHKYEEWRAQIIDIDGQMTEKTPLPLQEERRYFGKKTLAQVCQEQLKLRPFVDVKNPEPEQEHSEDEDIQIAPDGTVRKLVKKKSKQWLEKHKSCHFCLKRHPKWKMAFCYNCDLAYCYGALFRAHDMMPLVIMEDYNWKCPHCKRLCNTGHCRRDPRQHPYEPKGTLLGHDTKKVADVRSVECLVDFSVSNLNWLREDESAGRQGGPMQRRRDEAARAKLIDPSLDARYLDEDHEHDYDRNGITYSPIEDGNVDIPQGFVQPSSVRFSGFEPDPRMHEDDVGSYYPDPGANGEIPRLGKRNWEDEEEAERQGRRKKKKQKKRKDDEIQPALPKNASGKQFRKEINKKLFDDARKEDRFIIVMARLKKRSKLVKLRLHSEHLAAIQERPVVPRSRALRDEEESVERVNDTRSILQSDILPKTAAPNNASDKIKGPHTFRYRVEQDGTFATRKRDREATGAGKMGKPAKSYEEVTLDSDEELDEEDTIEYNPSEYRPRGRASNWLSRRNQGEEDLLTELPANFKDGDVNPKRARKRAEAKERRETMPAKLKAQIRPPAGRSAGRPLHNSTGNIADEDGFYEDDQANEALLLAQSAATALEASRKAEEEKAKARAAELEAEENLRAKMAVAEWAEDSENESIHDFIENLAAEDEPLHQGKEREPSSSPVVVRTSGPPKSENSILSRPGMNGKKIKIVSAKRSNGASGPSSASNTTTVTVAVGAHPSDVTKSKNGAHPKTMALSDESASDSEDEIPAKAPVPKRVGRPVGRPSRGRGRPRKTR